MKTTKINIGIALSRNYDKISLEILDEPIEHSTDAELKEIIKKKFAFLKTAVLEEFETDKEKPQEEKPKVFEKKEPVTSAQKKYLQDLNFQGDIEKLNKETARDVLTDLLNTPTGDY